MTTTDKFTLMNVLTAIYLQREPVCTTQYMDNLIQEGYVYINDYSYFSLTAKGYNTINTDPATMNPKRLSYHTRQCIVELAKKGMLDVLFARDAAGEKYFANFHDDTTKKLFAAMGIDFTESVEDVVLETPTDEVILETPVAEVAEVAEKPKKTRKKKNA
jgi:hypothetical protein